MKIESVNTLKATVATQNQTELIAHLSGQSINLLSDLIFPKFCFLHN